jgi:hypothetical protein
LLASRAELVLADVALRCRAEAAFLDEIGILLALFRSASVILKFADVLEPLKRSVVIPGVEEGDGFALNLLCR